MPATVSSVVLALGMVASHGPAALHGGSANLWAIAVKQKGADSKGFDRAVSGIGTYAYLGLGVIIPFLENDIQPRQQALRAMDATGIAVALSEGLKMLTRVPRPDTGTPDSFPSEHSAATFSIATVRSALRPDQAIYWYAGAALISCSRIRLNRHRIVDVLAGAAIGYGVARLELSQPRGLATLGLIDTPTRQLELVASQAKRSGFQPVFSPATRTVGFVYTTKF